MSTSLAAVLVTGAGVSYLATVFTRDAFFAFATFALFWTLIFADVFYAGYSELVRYNYVFAAVVLAAAMGVVVIEVLNTGILIDVWLEKFVPQFKVGRIAFPIVVVLVGFSFLATFFWMSTSYSLWFGTITITSPWSWIFAITFTLLAIVTFFAIAFTGKRTFSMQTFPGKLEVFYILAFLFMNGLPALFWHASFMSSLTSATRGWIVGGIAFFIDIILLLVCAWQERQDSLSKVGKDNDMYHGMYDGSIWSSALRAFIIALIHGAIFIVAGYADVNGTTNQRVIDVFWYPYLMTLFTVVIVIFGIIYAFLVFRNMTSTGKSAEETTLLKTADAPMRMPNGGKVSPPITTRARPATSRATQLQNIQFV